jgi:competence protein ComEC
MFPGDYSSVATQSRTLPAAAIVLACLATGFGIARLFDPLPAALWFSAAGVLTAIAAATRRYVSMAGLMVAAICFGTGWFTVRLYERPQHAMAALVGDASGLVEVRGVVLDTPQRIRRSRTPLSPFTGAGDLTTFRLRVTGVIDDAGHSHPAHGILRIRIPGVPFKTGIPPPQPLAGERISALGRFEPLAAPLNPGERDQRLWRGQEGIVGSLRLSGPSGLNLGADEAERLPATGWERAYSWWIASRAAMADRSRAILLGSLPPSTPTTPSPPLTAASGIIATQVDESTPTSHAARRPHGEAGQRQARALLGALILGEEDPALLEVRSAFQRLGLLHTLSISGFHLAVMAMVALVLLRAAGDLGWLEPLLASLLIALYIAILPFHAPVWRAGLMVCGLLLAQALGRRYQPLAMLCWIAIALLLWRPMDLWSVGFQLSFGLVAALIILGDTVHQRLWGVRLKGVIRSPRPAWWVWLSEAFKRLVTANLLCWAVAAPIIMYHVGMVSPLAVLAGVVMVPVISLLLIAGYAALLVGVLVPPLTSAIGTAVEWLAWVTTAATQWMDALPGTSAQSPPVSALWAVAATAVAMYWLVRGHLRDRLGWAIAAAVCGWLAGEAHLSGRLSRDQLLRVDSLAVGDGTCMLVRSREGAFLWDCGSLQGRVGQFLVPRSLRALGVWQVRTIVISHPNLDHYNGVLDLVQPLGVREVVIGEEFALQAKQRPSGPEAYLLSELAVRSVEVVTVCGGDVLRIGGIELEVLSPPPLAHGMRWKHDNDMSLVLGLRPEQTPAQASPKARRYPALLTGDIQQDAMQHLLRAYPGLHASIAEAPHHGAATQAAAEFLWTLGPDVVLQSTGPRRSGTGLAGPWRDIKDGGGWLTTAVDGAVWAAVDQQGQVRFGSFRRR